MYSFGATPEDRYNPAVTERTPIPAFSAALEGGRFFEAHEIVEAFWVDYDGADRNFFKGLIQAAVALHHASRGNGVGAASVARRAQAYLKPYAPRHAGVDVGALIERLTAAAA